MVYREDEKSKRSMNFRFFFCLLLATELEAHAIDIISDAMRMVRHCQCHGRARAVLLLLTHRALTIRFGFGSLFAGVELLFKPFVFI